MQILQKYKAPNEKYLTGIVPILRQNAANKTQTSSGRPDIRGGPHVFCFLICAFPFEKQGKKVCKVTAVQCAYLFLFAGMAEMR